MKKPFLISLISTMALACSLQAQTTIINDTFTDGTNPGYSVSGGGGTATVATTGTGLTGNALLLSTTSNNRTATRSFGSSITLANVSDYIEIGLDYRFAAILDVNFASTIALTGIGGVKGGINFNPSAAGNGGTYFTDSDSNSGRFDTIASGTTAHSLTLRITRTSATEAQLRSSFDGTPRSVSNFQTIGGATPGSAIASPLTFDGLEIGWVAGQQGDIYYDNVLVTTNVPEPTAIALLGVGFGGLLLRRRR